MTPKRFISADQPGDNRFQLSDVRGKKRKKA